MDGRGEEEHLWVGLNGADWSQRAVRTHTDEKQRGRRAAPILFVLEGAARMKGKDVTVAPLIKSR